ncbi:MAG: divalent-cation tolerance protein CutA [Nocardioidaceae bacterium]
MTPEAKHVQVTVAAADQETLAQLARSALGEKLAAGAHIVGPVPSFFWHLGEQGEGEEWHLVLKTTGQRYPELEAHLIAEHPWDNPEVSAVAITGAAAYLEWIERTVS